MASNSHSMEANVVLYKQGSYFLPLSRGPCPSPLLAPAAMGSSLRSCTVLPAHLPRTPAGLRVPGRLRSQPLGGGSLLSITALVSPSPQFPTAFGAEH